MNQPNPSRFYHAAKPPPVTVTWLKVSGFLCGFRNWKAMIWHDSKNPHGRRTTSPSGPVVWTAMSEKCGFKRKTKFFRTTFQDYLDSCESFLGSDLFCKSWWYDYNTYKCKFIDIHTKNVYIHPSDHTKYLNMYLKETYELRTKLLVWGICLHQTWGVPYRFSRFWMFRGINIKTEACD